MDRAETILKENIDVLHKLSKELLEREILDSEEIDKLIHGEELPPLKKEGNDISDNPDALPDHVKKLMEQRKPKEFTPKDDTNRA
jgi:cell division protease FtsH